MIKIKPRINHRRSEVSQGENKICLVLRTGQTLAVAITSTDSFSLAKGHCDEYKIIHAGCYFCDEPHEADECLHRAESIATSASSATEFIVSSSPHLLKIPFTEEPDQVELRSYSESDEFEPAGG